MQVTGFHHVTCIGSDPQRNIEFYSRVLGLRLLKQTVHFDHEDVYHLYYGDETGTPGSVLTFFPYPRPIETLRGSNSLQEVALAIPGHARDFWDGQFRHFGVEVGEWAEEFGRDVLRFRDHDGQRLKFVALDSLPDTPGWAGTVPGEHAIRGIQGVEIGAVEPEREVDSLVRHFGLVPEGEEGPITRLNLPGRKHADRYVDVRDMSKFEPAPPVPLEGAPARAGTVNHLAFGTENETTQLRFHDALSAAGFELTEVKDRRYFTSIYMLDVAGIRIEVATDECAGFGVDEDFGALGQALQLPPWFEHLRPAYEKSLPRIVLPAS